MFRKRLFFTNCSTYLHELDWSLCLACWPPLVRGWLPSLLLSSPLPPWSPMTLLPYPGCASSPPSPKSSEKGFFIITNYLCGQLTCTYEYACPGAYGVSGALQQEVDGSVYIFVAVVEGDHALVLSLPSNLNQLGMNKTGTLSENWNFPDNYDKTK